MNDEPRQPDPLNSIADFYGKKVGKGTDPLQHALQTWDHAEYKPLKERDPELYGLIINQLGTEVEILLGEGSVRLGTTNRQIELTWNGDDEDLLDLVLEGFELISEEE